MSRRAISRGDMGKTPIYAMSYGDDSSDDETTSADNWATRVLQSHFNSEAADSRPAGSFPMETRSRGRRLVKMASVSSESRTISSEASSRHGPATGKRASRGVMRAKDLLIDIKADFFGDEVLPNLGTRRHKLRPRFPPRQAGAYAHTGDINGGIKDTHLQRRLKDHPSAQAWKGEVCCISSFVIYIFVICMC